jgi:hypothetical protein
MLTILFRKNSVLTTTKHIFKKHPKTNMKFSTIAYFAIAFVMTFATSFGLADTITPGQNIRVRSLSDGDVDATGSGAITDVHSPEFAALSDDFKMDMMQIGLDTIFESSDKATKDGERKLVADANCIFNLCPGKVKGQCWRMYRQCYPL